MVERKNNVEKIINTSSADFYTFGSQDLSLRLSWWGSGWVYGTGGTLNSWSLSLYYRDASCVQFFVAPVAEIFGAKPDAQILVIISSGFQKNRGFTDDFNFIRERPWAGKNNPKTGHFKAENG
jgi:hypothetical protein